MPIIAWAIGVTSNGALGHVPPPPWACAGIVHQFGNFYLYTVCLKKKPGPLQLIWHNFTNLQHSLGTDDLIQFSIYCRKKFLNWLRTSCVVSITTVASDLTHLNSGFQRRLRTTYHRQGNKRAAKRLWACVSMLKDSIRTRVVTVDTAKKIIISIETLFV